jgi:Uma2 family endonuclease
MTTQPQLRRSPEEYLVAERQAEVKSEYHDGEVLAMAGASYVHNLIVANVIRELGIQLKGKPCNVLPSDVRVWIEISRRFVYPDVTVVCGPPQLTDAVEDTLVNPTLLVEVLSKSTSNYDRGEKFECYRSLDSFAEYVLLAQDRPHCEHYVRRSDGSWVLTEANRSDATVPLTTIGCELALAEVYEGVSFGPRPV